MYFISRIQIYREESLVYSTSLLFLRKRLFKTITKIPPTCAAFLETMQQSRVLVAIHLIFPQLLIWRRFDASETCRQMKRTVR